MTWEALAAIKIICHDWIVQNVHGICISNLRCVLTTPQSKMDHDEGGIAPLNRVTLGKKERDRYVSSGPSSIS
jgi:hypothetical protein